MNINNLPGTTPKAFLKTTMLLHLAFSVAIVLFIVVIYVTHNKTGIHLPAKDDIFLFIVPVAVIAGVFLGNLIYKKNINVLSQNDSLRQKLAKHQTATLIRYAFLEAPVFLGIVAYMNTENLFYLLLSGIVSIYFVSLRPVKQKIEKELNLNSEQRALFNKPDQMIT